MKTTLRWLPASLFALGLCALVNCSDSGHSLGTSRNGGSAGTGGTPAASDGSAGTGGTPASSGGSAGTGGTPAATGGTPASSGGSAGTGGTPVATGGTPASSGGSAGTGGTPVATGGTPGQLDGGSDSIPSAKDAAPDTAIDAPSTDASGVLADAIANRDTAGVSCSQLTTKADCQARSDCHAVFVDPGTCGCMGAGCCARFNRCVDGGQARCAPPVGGVQCTIATPFCESPYVLSYTGVCYEGCVLNTVCAP